MKTITTKLAAIQAALKAPKTQYNEFGRYHYRKCEDILEEVKPLLQQQKCALLCHDELQAIGERYYIKATATIYDTETGESICTTAYAREEETKKGMDGSQITGASSSYARKYALNGLFCIDDTQDSDTTNKGDDLPPAPKRTRSTAKSTAPAAKTYAGGLTESQYQGLVKAEAMGMKTKAGDQPRDAFIRNCKPTPAELEQFDADVVDMDLKLNAR